MRRMILIGLFALLAVSVANDACAQHRGGGGSGFARGGRGFSRAQAVSPYGFGYASLPYDYDYGLQPTAFVQQPPSYVQPPAPPVVEPPVRPVITEYKWPAGAATSPTDAEPQDFVIVLKDGSTLSAISVFASDDGLHYVDPNERHLLVFMSQVDRAATLKVNRARNLNLHLPAAQ
jgi:hypothetical protein